jgi:gliding motility-associated-like protein
VPDVFSPNGDVHNDVLYVRSTCISSLDFLVFDRWGNKIFETNNINQGWDGNYNGSPMNIGTYIWYLKGTTVDGVSIKEKGNVTLVR